MNATMKDIKAEHVNITRKQQALEESHLALKSEVGELKAIVARLEQDKLNLNLVIRGVPNIANDLVKETVLAIFKKVDQNYKSEIMAIWRAPPPKSEAAARAIYVRFATPTAKNMIFGAKRKVRVFCSDIVVKNKAISTNNDEVYFGDHLVPYKAGIYYMARQMKKKKQIYRAWSRNGRIFVKRNADDPGVPVETEEDLNEAVKSIAEQEKLPQEPRNTRATAERTTKASSTKSQ